MKITDEAKHAAYLALTAASMDDRVAAVQALEAAAPHLLGDEDTSDGFHTFRELYRHRMLLSAATFRMWYESDNHPVYPPDWEERIDPHKSRRHSDGELCFGGGWFIVVANLPGVGQISYHYPEANWDLFSIPEREIPAEFDGHTAQDVADRLETFLGG